MTQLFQHILVIDDDRVILRAIREILEADGHRVVVADCGQAGIDAFLKHRSSDSFNVVVTDLNMPDMDGDKVAVCIREVCPETSIILLTASADPKVLADRFSSLFDFVLSKPSSMEDLRNTISQCQGKIRAA